MPDAICELTLEARDVECLERFFREAFDPSVLAREDDRVWLAVGRRTRLGLWTPGPKEFDDLGGRHVNFAFSVDDGAVEEFAARLRRLGAVTRGPVEHSGGDRSLYVEAPEGNIVEVWTFFVDGDGEDAGVAALADETREPAAAGSEES
jgi:catechol-2,3-dioxygenase